VRPRFFAGQLLTEEDLQKLIDYLVAKNRLHNQRLWGDGVVCGLEVSCNPCGGGTVRVNPGYALDCCGNDLVLGCPQDLDINAMVRDLKRNLLGGIDCGDPCPPGKKETGPADDQKGPVIDTTRHYCLYIRYCENLTDPVSPYATDEGCNYQSCQPTRVSEGVTFELRCDEGSGHQTDIRDRICECIGDLDSAKQNTTTATALYSLNRLLGPIPNVEVLDRSMAEMKFVESVKNLLRIIPLKPLQAATKHRAATTVTPSHAGGEKVSSGTEQSEMISVQEFENRLSDIRTAAAHLASCYLLAQDRASRTNERVEADRSEETDDTFELSRRDFHSVVEKVKAQIDAISAPTSRALQYYSSLLKNTGELATATSKQPLVQFRKARLLMITKGFIFEPRDLESSVAPMMALRKELLDRLDRSPRRSDCRLLPDVLAIRLPDPEAITGWAEASMALSDAWSRYLKDCFCAAINPPCGPCDDPAVLLACLEVKDCEVVEICNLKRKFVISPTALRYWLPPLNYLGDLLEQLCCSEPLCDEEEGKRSDLKNQLLRLSRYPGIFELLCGPLKQGKLTTLVNRTKPGRILKGLDSDPPPTSSNHLLSGVASAVKQAFATTAVPLDKPIAEILRDAVIGDNAAIGKKLEELSTAVSKEGLNERLAEAVKAKGGAVSTAVTGLADASVAAAVQKLNLDIATKDLKDVKRITTENAELKKNLTALEERLKKLEGVKPK
jgi:hypothetical protein